MFNGNANDITQLTLTGTLTELLVKFPTLNLSPQQQLAILHALL